jgi:hypothetical protein
VEPPLHPGSQEELTKHVGHSLDMEDPIGHGKLNKVLRRDPVRRIEVVTRPKNLREKQQQV